MKAILQNIPLLAMLAYLVFSCGEKNRNVTIPKVGEVVPVKIMALSQMNSTNVVMASGQISSDDETVLSFKTGGIIDAVFVKEGDLVKKGQLLARLNLTEINASLAQARQAYEKAQRDYQRAMSLYKDSAATLEQLQNTQTGLSVVEEQLKAAHFNRLFSEIHAPAQGYVLQKFANAGQVVAGGTPVLITNGATQGKWIVRAGVSDKQWAAIKIHDLAELSVDAFPDKLFKARVIRKSERSDPQSGTFAIELQILDDQMPWATGMFASVKILISQITSSWNVPYESVLDANGNEGFVFITNDNKTAIRKAVTIESFQGNIIRISKGLENARALIVSGSAYLSDGSSLEIVQ